MNNSQRNFLIEKIEKQANIRIDALSDSRKDKPSLANHLLHAVMSDNFNIVSTDEIKELLKKRILRSTTHQSWLGDNHWQSSKGAILFKLEEFFELPEEYKKQFEEWKRETKVIDEEISTLHAQLDGLVTRIKLASNSTLESMIREVDDMGDITLIDTKLKLLSQ